MYKNERMKLRKASREDLLSLWYLKNESWFGTHRHAIINMQDQEEWFNTIDNHSHSPRRMVLIAEATHSTSPVGMAIIDVDWVNRDADLSWAIYEYFRKKGHGKELVSIIVEFCFKVLDLRRISCEILQSNKASERCALTAGFQYEGFKREAVCKNGEYVGSHYMGILKSDFTSKSVLAKTSPSPEERKGIHLVSSSGHTISA